MQLVAALGVGLLFGLGLITAGMSNPAKVLAFLDLGGAWDPSLALVMAGAIGVTLLPVAVAKRMNRTLLGTPMVLPTADIVDARLVVGSIAFGVGWGLVGFCPGPALVALGMGETKAIVFVAAMLAGMGIYELFSIRDRIRFSRFVALAARDTARPVPLSASDDA